MLNLLVEPIRRDFLLDDVSISFLLGFAFVLAFAFAAPFAGRWADQGHRRNICVFAVTMWSVFTIACGLAGSYRIRFVARMGVGEIGRASGRARVCLYGLISVVTGS